MARRNSKADRILNESAMRPEAAIMRERLAQSQLNTAKAVLEAVQAAHDALTRELTPQPRSSAKKPVTSAPAQKDPLTDKEPHCAFVFADETVCSRIKDNPVHRKDGGYAGYHPFEPTKAVARAGRKSKVKPGSTSSIPSSELETEPAIAASSGGD